jgi:tagaturonate epimerase
MKLDKYSIGIGDRFGHEGGAQLRALDTALRRGTEITPVWNKSHREHALTGTSPKDVRRRAEKAVRAGGWPGAYYVDADHIGMATVEDFLDPCDFFTIDVAAAIGQMPPADSAAAFLRHTLGYKGELRLPGLDEPLEVTDELLGGVARKYLAAVEEAARVYRHVADRKGADPFIVELSLDEADAPQTPGEILFILAAAAEQGLPVQTIAPKFPGAFFKGIDYLGDTEEFARDFRADLAVLEFARKTFGLPRDLKLSVHSGSDKFSLYPLMHRALVDRDAGLHLKTAGTTWLEEVIGLAASGGAGLRFARDLAAGALDRFEELAKPYLAVISIDPGSLPSADAVQSWGAQEYVEALQHDPACPSYNPHFRQLVHISFPLAAKMGDKFTGLLERHREPIETRVTDNLLRRHVGPLFLGGPAMAAATAT